MIARGSVVLALAALTGCSLAFDPGRHTGGGMDAGGGLDAGIGTDAGQLPDGGLDAGPGVDAGPGSDAGGDAGADAGGDAGPGVTIDEFCPMFVDLVCGSVRTCCSRAPAGWDDASCRTRYTDVCAQTTQRVRDYAYLEWDDAAAHRALAEGAAYIATCATDIQDWYIDLDGFFAPINGTRGRGVECTPTNDTNTYEVLAAILSCQPGLRCIRGSGRWNCLDPSPNGMPCSLAFDCADPTARCTRRVFNAVCESPGEETGSICATADECESLVCRGLRCEPATQDNVYCLEGVGLPDM